MGDTARGKTEEFILEEYKYFTSSFWRNEEAGERRVNFFITLVTAVIGALVTLATRTNFLLSGVEYVIVVFALFALLAFGIITLLRMIHRNTVTDEYKDKTALVRDFFTEDERLKNYEPFPSPKPRAIGRGGLAEMVAAINSLLVVAIGLTLALLILSASQRLESAFLVLGLVGLVSFVVAMFLQFSYMKRCFAKDWQKREEARKKQQAKKNASQATRN